MLGGILPAITLCGGGVDLLLHLDVAHMRDRADVIVTGRLKSVGPYKESPKGFYEIVEQDVLKGMLPTNSLLVVHTGSYSTEGSDPIIESLTPYCLFLEKVNLDIRKAPSNMVNYQVIGTWKGIIPLYSKARERRAIIFIEKDYGVDISEKMRAFTDAIRYSIDRHTRLTNEPRKALAAEAYSLYEKLQLAR
jgi:hypothetical protein